MSKTADNLLMVGLTGRSGSGKSSVGRHYAARGYPVADGDIISREATQPGHPCLSELHTAFGDAILHRNGTLDRGALARLAFACDAGTQKLISITHPYILNRTLELAQKARAEGSPLFFIDGAVIVGGPVQPHCDKIIVVMSETHLTVSRIILRDGISKTAANRRLAAQLPEAELCAAADFIIENNAGQQALLARADEVLTELLKIQSKQNCQ